MRKVALMMFVTTGCLAAGACGGNVGNEETSTSTEDLTVAERYRAATPTNERTAVDDVYDATIDGQSATDRGSDYNQFNIDGDVGKSEEGFEVVATNEYTGASMRTSYTPLPLTSDLDRRMSRLRGFDGKYQSIDHRLGRTSQTYVFDNLCPEREENILMAGRNQFGIAKGNSQVRDDDLFEKAQSMVICQSGLRPVRMR